MRTIKSEIEIEASADTVWKVLMNHQEYPNWNPFIKELSGSTVPGEQLSATIKSEGNSPMSFKPVVLKNEVNEEFRWKGKLLINGIFDGEHYFLIEEISPNKIRFIQGENFTGILSGIFMIMIREGTKKGFISMNQALKSIAESN